MPSSDYKDRFSTLQNRFNETFGENPLINPRIRRKAIFAMLKLGILERQISKNHTLDDVSEFTRIATILENIFAEIECHYKTGNRQKQAARKSSFPFGDGVSFPFF